MEQVNRLHQEAMQATEAAFHARSQGDHAAAEKHLRRAMEKETEAASLVVEHLELEPTRSILHRSAATLALDCREIREAERLISVALAGQPPPDITEELRDLMEQVYFDRHLDLRGVRLQSDEMQLSLAGSLVGHGLAQSEELIVRVSNLEKMIHRTNERRRKSPYRSGGRLPQSLREECAVFLSVPRAASYAVTVKISQPTQYSLIGPTQGQEIFDDIIASLSMINAEQERALQEHIADEKYYRNFVGLAKKLAPDGDRISQVGFTVWRDGQETRVALRRQRSSMSRPGEETEVEGGSETISISGVLRFADSIRPEEQIRVVDDRNKTHTILVPEGLMDDIVKPLWGERVVVMGRKRGKMVVLEDIDEDRSD